MTRKFLYLLPFFVFAMLPSIVEAQEQERQIGVNLSQVKPWSPQWMFVDVMKQARAWRVRPADNDDIFHLEDIEVPQRADGYPTQVPFSFEGEEYIVHTFMTAAQEFGYPAGDYTLIFEGTGQILVSGDVPEATYTQSNTPHILSNPDPTFNGINLSILSSDAADPIRNIRVIMPGFLETYESEPFHPLFLELIEPFEVLRYIETQSTNETLISEWEDHARLDHYSQSVTAAGNLSVDYIAQLSNRSGTDPWVNIPARADDNYVRQFARVLNDSLDQERAVYIQYGNENWNPNFESYQHVLEQGQQRGYSDNPDPDINTIESVMWYDTFRSLQIFEIFEEEFGGTDRLVRILSPQTGFALTGDFMMAAYNSPIANPDNVEADVLAMHTYFGAGFEKPGSEFNGVDDIIERGNLDLQTVDSILDSLEQYLRFDIVQNITDYRALAQQNNLGLVTYEGGQHLVSDLHRDNDQMTQLLNAANRHFRMEQIYCDYYDIWYNEFEGGLNNPFSFITEYEESGSWGLLEYMNQPASMAPKWRAHQNCVFNSVAVSNEEEGSIPSEIQLSQNFPNPFNPTTNIQFTIPQAGEVRLDVYDLLGRQITTLVNERRAAGEHTVTFDASSLSSGVYVYQLKTGNAVLTRKLTLIK